MPLVKAKNNNFLCFYFLFLALTFRPCPPCFHPQFLKETIYTNSSLKKLFG
eukprot:UN03030